MGTRRKSTATVARTKRGSAPRRPSLPQMLARMSTRECARKAAHAGKLKEALVRLRTELQAIDADVAAVRVRDPDGLDTALGVDDAPITGPPPGFPPLATATTSSNDVVPVAPEQQQQQQQQHQPQHQPQPQPQLMSYIDAVLTLPPRTPSAPTLPARRQSNANANLPVSRSQMPLKTPKSSAQQPVNATPSTQKVPAPTTPTTPKVRRSTPNLAATRSTAAAAAAAAASSASANDTPRQHQHQHVAAPTTPRQPPPSSGATPPPLPRRASALGMERECHRAGAGAGAGASARSGSVLGSRALEDAKSILASALAEPSSGVGVASPRTPRAPRAPFGAAGTTASFNRNGTTLSFAEWAHNAARAGAGHTEALARAKTVAPYDARTHPYRTADNNLHHPMPQGRRTPLAPRNVQPPPPPPQQQQQAQPMHQLPLRYVQHHPHALPHAQRYVHHQHLPHYAHQAAHTHAHAHARQPTQMRAPPHQQQQQVYTRAASALAAGRTQLRLPHVQPRQGQGQGQGSAPQSRTRRPCTASTSSGSGVPALMVSDAAGAPLRWAGAPQ